jgi:hypothetical protein
MDYKTLEKKWLTGKPEKANVTICRIDGIKENRVMTGKQSLAPLGDFIKEYMDHVNTPWWRRKYDWEIVENRMREYLNQASVTWVSF